MNKKFTAQDASKATIERSKLDTGQIVDHIKNQCKLGKREVAIAADRISIESIEEFEERGFRSKSNATAVVFSWAESDIKGK